MLTTAQFTIALTWKQPKHPLTVEWIKKMWYTYTMEYYAAIKMPFAATWMNLEITILNKSDRERQICVITYLWNLKIGGTNELICRTEIESQM